MPYIDKVKKDDDLYDIHDSRVDTLDYGEFSVDVPAGKCHVIADEYAVDRGITIVLELESDDQVTAIDNGRSLTMSLFFHNDLGGSNPYEEITISSFSKVGDAARNIKVYGSYVSITGFLNQINMSAGYYNTNPCAFLLLSANDETAFTQLKTLLNYTIATCTGKVYYK